MSCTVPNLSQNTLQLGSFHLSRHNTWRWDSWIAAPPHYRRACLRVHSYCQIHPARGRCRAGRPAAQWISRTCPSHPCSACMSRHRSWRFAWCAVERPRSQHSRLRLGGPPSRPAAYRRQRRPRSRWPCRGSSPLHTTMREHCATVSRPSFPHDHSRQIARSGASISSYFPH